MRYFYGFLNSSLCFKRAKRFFYIVGMIVVGEFLGMTICIIVLLINEISKVFKFMENIKERHDYKSVVEKAVKDLEG